MNAMSKRDLLNLRQDEQEDRTAYLDEEAVSEYQTAITFPASLSLDRAMPNYPILPHTVLRAHQAAIYDHIE